MVTALRRGGLLVIGLAGALLAPIAQAADGDFVVPGSKAAGLKSCVEPTELMRRAHMELIQHQRDATVHQGIRSTKHSLAECISCHVSKGGSEQFIPINRGDQFCGACHAYAAVGLDCFQCHATVPDAKGTSAASGGKAPAGAWVVPGGPAPGEGR